MILITQKKKVTSGTLFSMVRASDLPDPLVKMADMARQDGRGHLQAS